jgi:hypothetical protein
MYLFYMRLNLAYILSIVSQIMCNLGVWMQLYAFYDNWKLHLERKFCSLKIQIIKAQIHIFTT